MYNITVEQDECVDDKQVQINVQNDKDNINKHNQIYR